jgi:hypothetical protein
MIRVVHQVGVFIQERSLGVIGVLVELEGA